MPGLTDLDALLAGMSPKLRDEVYVFATLPPAQSFDPGQSFDPVQSFDPGQALMSFREAAGLTLILDEESAGKAGLRSTFRCRMITLEVQSSLEAVGFLARITTALAAAGIGVNPVSAYHHDHLFVPVERAEEALGVLQVLQRGSGTSQG